MVWNEILSFVFIACSALIYACSLQCNTKNKIFFVQLFSTCFYLASYIVIVNIRAAALIGTITAAVEILRIIAFYLIEKTRKFDTRRVNGLTALFFSLLLVVCAIFTWSGWICLLPVVGGIIVSFAMGSKNLLMMKIAFALQSILITIYLFLLTLWFNAFSQVFVLIFSIIGLITFLAKRNHQKN